MYILRQYLFVFCMYIFFSNILNNNLQLIFLYVYCLKLIQNKMFGQHFFDFYMWKLFDT